MKRTCRSELAVALVFSAVLLLDADVARAQYFFSWTSTGSTGVVDEADLSEVVFDSVGVALRATTPAQTRAVIRYPIATNSFGTFTSFTLTMVYQRPDDWAYASATLKRFSLVDGTTTVGPSVNAWDKPPSPASQAVEKTITCANLCGFSSSAAYYIEVSLWKPDAASNPRVLALRLSGY